MRITSLIAAALWALAVLATPASAANTHCTLNVAASVPMGRDSLQRPTIPVRMDGHDEHLLVDTGGVASLITPGIVNALKAKTLPVRKGALVIATGQKPTAIAVIGTLQVGQLIARNAEFFVIPDAWMMPFGESGSFGADFLRAWVSTLISAETGSTSSLQSTAGTMSSTGPRRPTSHGRFGSPQTSTFKSKSNSMVTACERSSTPAACRPQ